LLLRNLEFSRKTKVWKSPGRGSLYKKWRVWRIRDGRGREREREGVERAVLTFGVRGFLWFFKVLWGFPIGIGKC
jgi:hypothetical protein